jgi:hypothetical protein
MGRSIPYARKMKSHRKSKPVDESSSVRREFGELFEAFHNRLVAIERKFGLLPSAKKAAERIAEVSAARRVSRN